MTSAHPSILDPDLETATPSALRRLENERLREQIAYNCATSPYYRERLDRAGVRPEHIRHVEDLALVPFMEKTEIAASQADGTLIGINQCAPLDRIVRIQATGGTTGQPMRLALTRRDCDDYAAMGARALWAMGCRPGDVVFECMNYNLYSGGMSDTTTFERLGAATIPYGVGHSERLVEMMAAIKGDIALWATPSYAVRLAEVAITLGHNPRDIGLRKGFFSGEAGMQVPGFRDRIEALWGLRAQDQYGTGELGLHSGECEARSGLHYGGLGSAVIELIDPDTGAVLPLDDGRQGEAVYTSIWREASPLMRMRSHDIFEIFTEPCRCGRTSFRLNVLGRSDDMFIVKGVNIFPQSIQAVILKLGDRVTGEYQVVLDRPPPIDYPVPVRVEVAAGVPDSQHPLLSTEIAHRLQQALNFTPAIRLEAAGTFATGLKVKRVVRTYRQ
jgi:phenylacetate-CoA ligase